MPDWSSRILGLLAVSAKYVIHLRCAFWVPDVEQPLFVLGSRYRGQPVMLTEVGGFLQVPSGVPEANRDMLFDFYGAKRTPNCWLSTAT
jgi:hypothetical protein